MCLENLLKSLFDIESGHCVFTPEERDNIPDSEIKKFTTREDVIRIALEFVVGVRKKYGKGNRRAETKTLATSCDNTIAMLPEEFKTDPPVLIQRPGAIPDDHAPKRPAPAKISFTLEKNAKAGEKFCSVIQTVGSEQVEILDIIVPDGIGEMAYKGELRQLVGTPIVAGDHILKIRYRYADSDPGRPALESECTLTVNADPRSLWKDLPSDPDAPNWKRDMDKKYLQGAHGRRLVAASKRGRSHAHVGGFREDDFFLDVAAGWNVLAVADGAGSAKMSRRGSQLATQKAGKYLVAALGDEQGRKLENAAPLLDSKDPSDRHSVKKDTYTVLATAAHKAYKAIEDEATQPLVKDYSTTLILGVHKETSDGRHLFASYWVGDGAVAVYHKGTGVNLLGEVDSGQFAGQTRFLDRSLVNSADETMKRIRIELVGEFTALVLMTDGISDPEFETDQNLKDGARWDVFWGEVEPLLGGDAPDDRLLEWLDFWSPGNHDDRTIALLW